MKYIAGRILALILLAILLLGEAGCMNAQENKELFEDLKQLVQDNNEVSVSNAKALLEQKYNKKFEVKKIGDRLDRETVALLVYPQDNPELFFSVRLNNDEMVCYDNYIKRIVGRNIASELASELEQSEITVSSAVYLMSDDDSNETNTEIETEEFFGRYNVDGMMMYMIISGDSSNIVPDKISSVCEALADKYNVTVALDAYFIAKDYDACAQALNENSEVNSSWFSFYNPAGSFGGSFLRP